MTVRNQGSGGVSNPRKTSHRAQGYSQGNGNWNTERYNQSVHTSRTDTHVINSDKKRTYYYDNTPAAVNARQKKRFRQRKTAWEKAVKNNVRLRRFRNALIYGTSVIVAIAMIATATYYLFFTVSNVTITGNTYYSSEQIMASSGITEKTHLYSFSSKKLASDIIFSCPRISSVTVERSAPNSVTLSITEENPAYYTTIYGETYLLSQSLRILEKTDIETAKSEGFGKLKIKKVFSAVSGGKIVLCSSRAQKYLENTLELVNASDFKGRINSIDMTDEFNIIMTVDGLYKLEFGSQDDIDIKLRLASAVLKDSMFNSGNKAYIDLTDTTKTSVIVDNQLEID